MKKITAGLMAMLLLAWALTGCHTLHGAGEDISAAGRAIQDAAD